MEKKQPDTEPRVIRISVRDLVEFVMRGGDIDNRRLAGAEREAMQAGSRIHRKIQRGKGGSYHAEVVMKHTVDEGEFVISLEGRADGVIIEDGGVTIDEIKGVYLDIDRLTEPVKVHLAQAMCYGYMYCADHDLAEVTVQVTYCNLENENIRIFSQGYTREELETWFDGLIHEYVKWARYLHEHAASRDASLKELEFPYAYREGQKELAVSVYRAIARERSLFIQAPTGVGKTLSVVYPGLKAMGEGLVEKIFYLTARTITRSVAEETFAILKDRGMHLKSVTVTAKEKLCFLEKPSCNPDDCPYAKGHFDRVNDAIWDLIHREFGITRALILRYAEEYRVCPFEFCLDVSSWVDAVICDYNYVFDPDVRLKRYFSEGAGGEYLFLVDEAHNLVSRAREMYSASLVKEDVLQAKRLLAGKSAKVCRYLERVNKLLLAMKRETEGYVVHEEINALAVLLNSLYGELENFLDDNRQFEERELVLDFYFELRSFLMIYDRLDEAYTIYSEILADGQFMVKLFCMNPAGNLKECLEKGRSTIFFSATLLPVNYYKELLSGNLDDYAVYAESPFPRENRLLLVADDVSSRYTRRNRREFEKVADYIRAAVCGRRGNYMVFFPSYAYLNEVMAVWEEKERQWKEPVTVVCQDSRMNEAQKEEFLRMFEEEREESLAAFCVMGGVFSEGIDLKEERLIGAIVVGAGLPMVCTEQELLKAYFDRQEKRGFDYAYQYPGMNKVQQAAGRVIRTMEDKGVILLLDDRFLRDDYQAVFPREWRPFSVVNQRNVGQAIEEFWRRNPDGRP